MKSNEWILFKKCNIFVLNNKMLYLITYFTDSQFASDVQIISFLHDTLDIITHDSFVCTGRCSTLQKFLCFCKNIHLVCLIIKFNKYSVSKRFIRGQSYCNIGLVF